MKTLLEDTGFKIHFAAYVLVNLMLIAINLLTTPNTLWFYWPLIGWGIGILAHGASIYYVGNRRVTRETVARRGFPGAASRATFSARRPCGGCVARVRA